MTSLRTARVAPKKAVFRPALPLRFTPGLYGTDGYMPAKKRKSISKKIRFEVFKRDAFKCQYCGAMSPDVLLEVDHIQPVSLDGEDDILNFITACKDCNSGKSNRPLGDDTAVKKQQAQLVELQERREQLDMMLRWRDGLKDMEDDQVELIAQAWARSAPGWHLNDSGKKSATKLLKKHGLQKVLDAIDTSCLRYIRMNELGKATQESVDGTL